MAGLKTMWRLGASQTRSGEEASGRRPDHLGHRVSTTEGRTFPSSETKRPAESTYSVSDSFVVVTGVQPTIGRQVSRVASNGTVAREPCCPFPKFTVPYSVSPSCTIETRTPGTTVVISPLLRRTDMRRATGSTTPRFEHHTPENLTLKTAVSTLPIE